MNVEKVMRNLEKHNMLPYFVERKEDVVPLVQSLIPPGARVTVGGSMTLKECGVMDHLRSGRYEFLDREKPGLSRAEIEEIYRDAFRSDVYLCSSNAITENGELFNVDGNSNRVAALLYGPKSVILVVGVNKIVETVSQAAQRVKHIAAPQNCVRLNCDTFCRSAGKCSMADRSEIGSGCNSASRICCNYVISSMQREKNRIKVILVGEKLGY